MAMNGLETNNYRETNIRVEYYFLKAIWLVEVSCIDNKQTIYTVL